MPTSASRKSGACIGVLLINRTGYQDTYDTMASIDLDYGAAVTAIAIESVARATMEIPPK